MRRGLAVGAVLVLLLSLAPPARACSCSDEDPRTMLARSDAAFVGTLVEAPPPGRGDDADQAQQEGWLFAVEREVKGELGERVTVWSGMSSCRLSARKGVRIGLFLGRQGDRWTAGSCSSIDPERLLAAAQPLPAPDGSGHAAFVVGGEFGDTGVLALDESGRTLAHGKADGGSSGVSVCPGGKRVVALRHMDAGRAKVILYDLPGLAPVRTRELVQDAAWVMEAGCGDAAGDDVFVFFEKSATPQSTLTLYRLHRDDPAAPVWSGPGTYPPTFDPGGRFAVVPVREPASLMRIELPSGRAKRLAMLPEPAGRVAVHPTGRSVLTMAAREQPNDGTRIFVTGMDGRPLAERSLPEGVTDGAVAWSGPDQVTISMQGGVVQTFDGRLRPVADWSGALGWGVVEREGRVYWLHKGDLHSADPRTGGAARLRDLPEGRSSALAAVPRQKGAAPTTTSTTSSALPSTTSAPSASPHAGGGVGMPSLPAASTGAARDEDVPGAVGAIAVVLLTGAAFAAQVVARRRLRTLGTP